MDPILRRLRLLVDGIKQVLDPFGHNADRDRAARRWGVRDSEYVTAWFQTLLQQCKGRTRCYETRRCVYYETPDQAARNYKVCESLFLEIEAGHVRTTLRPVHFQMPPSDPEDPEAASPGGSF